jgi:hypothetical protein
MRGPPLAIKFRGEQPCVQCRKPVGATGYKFGDELICHECGERELARLHRRFQEGTDFHAERRQHEA